MKVIGAEVAVAVAGLAVLALVIYKAAPKIGAAAADAANAVNPLNHDNVFAGGVNKLGGIIAGDTSGDWTLGGWIYDVTHPTPTPTPTLPQASYDETARLLKRYPNPNDVATWPWSPDNTSVYGLGL